MNSDTIAFGLALFAVWCMWKGCKAPKPRQYRHLTKGYAGRRR